MNFIAQIACTLRNLVYDALSPQNETQTLDPMSVCSEKRAHPRPSTMQGSSPWTFEIKIEVLVYRRFGLYMYQYVYTCIYIYTYAYIQLHNLYICIYVQTLHDRGYPHLGFWLQNVFRMGFWYLNPYYLGTCPARVL